MVGRMKLQVKMLFPLSLLILVVLILTANMLSGKYTEALSLKELEDGVQLATKISDLIHSTQKERGMSSGYLASEGKKFRFEMLRQRKITDDKVAELTKLLPTIKEENSHQLLLQALHDIDRLHLLRKKIDSLNIGVEETIRLFSQMNECFLNVIVALSKSSKIPHITQQFTAYDNFLYAKENAGIERAVGTAILADDQPLSSMKVYFIEVVATQEIYTKIFLNYATKEARAYYERMCDGKVFNEVKRIRDVIIYSEDDNVISAEYWFENVTQKINRLQQVNNYLELELSRTIRRSLHETYMTFGIFAVLNFLSIISFLFMIMLIIKLIKSEQRLKAITDRYIISSTTDTKGRILAVSDAFCSISGYSREELVGKPHSIVRHPDMPKEAFREMWDTIRRGESWQGKIKNRKKDGGYYWVYANIEPLFDRKKQIEGYAAVRLDITDSIHLEEELKRSKEKDETLLHQSKLAQMGEMISMIAHQWRQPLTAISSTSNDMYMKIMLDQYDSNYFMQKLDQINEFSKHLSQTIDDFRNFYKKDTKVESSTYTEVVKGALDIIETSIVNKNITLKTELHSCGKIHVRVNELRQVLLNLIKNAEDVLLEREVVSPFIHIESYDKEGSAYLKVCDNGGGIPEDIIHTIFDPYFSTKTKKDGTGLGLYMSKIIVEDHAHGKLSVKNSDQGACFTIILPIEEED